jgi:hypothetical protein
MKKTYAATRSIRIQAPAAEVWEALTRPELVKQYLFGTDLTADWQFSSPPGSCSNPSQESAEHSAANWAMVLEGLKKLLER